MSEKTQTRDQYGPPLGSRILPSTLTQRSSIAPTRPTQHSPNSIMIRSTAARPTASQIVQTPPRINTPRPRGLPQNPLIPCSNRFEILHYNNTLGSPRSSTPFSDYQEKPDKLPLFPIETSWTNMQPREIAARFFPSSFHYLPANTLKTRTFYEFILVDTGSVEITHKQEQNQIIYSKFKIMKFISLEEWGQPLHQAKMFSRIHNPQIYTYYDYIDAWYNTLFLQPYQHSWFFWFKKGIFLKFPSWFVKWFYDVGPLPSIFPQQVQEMLQYFKDNTDFPQGHRLMAFTASQAITWIMT